MRVPQNGWFIVDNPIKMDDILGTSDTQQSKLEWWPLMVEMTATVEAFRPPSKLLVSTSARLHLMVERCQDIKMFPFLRLLHFTIKSLCEPWDNLWDMKHWWDSSWASVGRHLTTGSEVNLISLLHSWLTVKSCEDASNFAWLRCSAGITWAFEAGFEG